MHERNDGEDKSKEREEEGGERQLFLQKQAGEGSVAK